MSPQIEKIIKQNFILTISTKWVTLNRLVAHEDENLSIVYAYLLLIHSRLPITIIYSLEHTEVSTHLEIVYR